MKLRRYSRNLLVTVLLFSLSCAFSGCIYLVVGSIGAVGGYIVSPDTVEGITYNESDRVWDTAIEVISIMGLIDEKNEAGGVILANANKAKVTITIVSMSQASTKVTVKARKAYLPRISIAQDVFVKIMSRLNE